MATLCTIAAFASTMLLNREEAEEAVDSVVDVAAEAMEKVADIAVAEEADVEAMVVATTDTAVAEEAIVEAAMVVATEAAIAIEF